MSRSYRYPVWVDSYGSKTKKLDKRFANKSVRRANNVQNGKWYRKLYNPWNIVDWRSYWDPNPRVWINSWTGEIEIINPTPEWKARRK